MRFSTWSSLTIRRTKIPGVDVIAALVLQGSGLRIGWVEYEYQKIPQTPVFYSPEEMALKYAAEIMRQQIGQQTTERAHI